MTPSPSTPTPTFTDLAKKQISALLQKAITVGCSVALAKHVDASTVSAISALLDPVSIANELVLAAVAAYHLWENRRQNTKLVVAAATGQTTAKASQADTVMLLRAGLLPAKPVSADAVAQSVAPLPVPPAPPGFTAKP